MTEIWNRIKELAKLVEKGYKNVFLINSKNRIFTSINNDIDVNYVQFARKFIMPKWIFEGSVDNTMIAKDYIDDLKHLETNYFINKLEDSQKDQNSYSINKIDPEELANHFLSINNATDLFIPLNIVFNKQFYSFYNQHPYFEMKGLDRIKIGNKSLRLHWSTNSIPFDKIFVLDSSGVKWSQKKVKNMVVSRAKDPYIHAFRTFENRLIVFMICWSLSSLCPT